MNAIAAARPINPFDGIIRWAFGVAAVITRKGKAITADRTRTSPGTFSTSPKFIAIGTGATGAARTATATDTALSTEVETRTTGTESTVETTFEKDTYQVSGSVTATAERKVDEVGLFDASTSGNMYFSATHNVDTLSSGESISYTVRVQQS